MTLQGYYTNKGRALAAKVAGGTAALTITRVDAGSGHTADIPAATSLPDTEQTLTVGSAVVEDVTATLPVTLAEALSTVSYALTELGVYVSDPDEGEILFQVYQLGASAAVTAHGEGVLRFFLRQSIGAQGVTVVCSPAGILLESDLAPVWTALAKKPDAQMSALTLHVAKTGSDTTGDGSAGNPYQTIQKALNTLPRYIGNDTDVVVHSGSYDEEVGFYGFGGSGQLTVRAADNESVSVRSMVVWKSFCPIEFKGFTMTGERTADGETILVGASSFVQLKNITCTKSQVGSSAGAILLSGAGTVRLYNVTLSKKKVALEVSGGTCYLNNTVTGSNNTVGIRAGSGYATMGGTVFKGGATLGGSEQTYYSGVIL